MNQKSGKRGPGRPPKAPAPTGEKPELTDEQWRGLKRELRGCEDLAKWQRDGWPSSTSTQLVAEAAGVTRQMVYTWRKDPAYAAGLVWLESRRLIHGLEDNDRAVSEARITMVAEATIEMLSEDAPNKAMSSTVECRPKGETDEREFWVEPDPSLFKGDSQRGFEMAAEAWIEMAAKAWIEMLGEDALNMATSRATEFKRKGTADQRKLWTRLAHVIQELLDRRSDNATSQERSE